MADVKLFRLTGAVASELAGESTVLEKPLQTLIERNLETLLGVRFLESEYSTGRVHGGRIDTLGIDENDCPVIVEYKRDSSDTVINQGLFYLDWLMDHRAEFELLVQKRMGVEAAQAVDWSSPRLICIAGDFTRYDDHAVRQISRNIDLIRYKRFGSELLLFELATTTGTTGYGTRPARSPQAGAKSADKPFVEVLAAADASVRAWYEELRDFITHLGDDVDEKQVKLYVAFRRIKNFACVVASAHKLIVYLKIDPTTVAIEEGFMRDVRQIGHWATGDLELTVDSGDRVEQAKAWLRRAYEGG